MKNTNYTFSESDVFTLAVFNPQFRDALTSLLNQYRDGLKVVPGCNELRFGCLFLSAVLNHRDGSYKSITADISQKMQISLSSAYAYKREVLQTINKTLQENDCIAAAF
jgi:hypothetical protein